MADAEQTRGRLANIRTVQPILGALRTISLGSWQAALNRRASLQRYVAQLQALLPLILGAAGAGALPGRSRFRRAAAAATESLAPRQVLLAVGSERGLCGRFNQVVAEQTLAYLEQQQALGATVELAVLGSRLSRLLVRRDVPISWSAPLSTSALPPFSQARALTRDWLVRYEAHTLDAVDVLLNAYRGVGRYETVVQRLIPPAVSPVEESAGALDGELVAPFIIETDPWSFYVRVVEQETMIRCYSLLLESATSEHATRYQLMEGATQNAERLMEELTLELQALRRQAITREMQELAVGAGLLTR